ncbi:arabinan endo-1,5-alpha-L-arabinosidase [Roseivirga sp. BDSF3-8]|uniref:arabinan endo-1,5-alpha-L-arabinosidase n=1 Tax=Roseivirga sp. BDSF3-8 TaxID=3241598 RepID=UPI003531ED96
MPVKPKTILKSYQRWITVFSLLLCFGWLAAGCGEEEIEPAPNPTPGGGERPDTTELGDGPIDFSRLPDTYGHLATAAQVYDWMHYNSHDPSVIDARDYVMDAGDFFYSYSTDVSYGHTIRPGLQIRRSINLVEWEYVGWVFNAIPTAGATYIRQNGGTPNNSLWAPYAIQVGSEYRVYYSLASNVGRLSAIGLAVSDSPMGPFVERGLVVTSQGDNSTHTNAIDPSIIIDQSGNQYMYYGSSWDGIYMMELDPATGLAATEGDIGQRVAHRGFSGNTINGNIEGPEIIYNEEEGMYYLFIAYDWLETKYNVRVGRSESPTGPFYDFNGDNLNEFSDNQPMILAPYRFQNHSGWQGVSHPAVFEKDGQYFMAHQGRPGIDRFFMVLHVRQVFWTEDGWPIVSPQRYANEEETAVEESELPGTWEQIVFGYNVVPGFAETQTNPDFQQSVTITLDAGGTINGDNANTWSYEAPWLTLSWGGGAFTDKVYVERGRDWENEVASTILFTGLNEEGTTIWGKKVGE